MATAKTKAAELEAELIAVIDAYFGALRDGDTLALRALLDRTGLKIRPSGNLAELVDTRIVTAAERVGAPLACRCLANGDAAFVVCKVRCRCRCVPPRPSSSSTPAGGGTRRA